MKKLGNIVFILVSVWIIIVAAYAGATSHEHCDECNRSVIPTQQVQFFVEGSFGMDYILATW